MGGIPVSTRSLLFPASAQFSFEEGWFRIFFGSGRRSVLRVLSRKGSFSKILCRIDVSRGGSATGGGCMYRYRESAMTWDKGLSWGRRNRRTISLFIGNSRVKIALRTKVIRKGSERGRTS